MTQAAAAGTHSVCSCVCSCLPAEHLQWSGSLPGHLSDRPHHAGHCSARHCRGTRCRLTVSLVIVCKDKYLSCYRFRTEKWFSLHFWRDVPTLFSFWSAFHVSSRQEDRSHSFVRACSNKEEMDRDHPPLISLAQTLVVNGKVLACLHPKSSNKVSNNSKWSSVLVVTFLFTMLCYF